MMTVFYGDEDDGEGFETSSAFRTTVPIVRELRLMWGHTVAHELLHMCFGLFIATGSFFFGQAKFIPEPIRIGPLLGALGVAPLVILLYWMWRIRLRRRLTGIIVRPETSAVPS